MQQIHPPYREPSRLPVALGWLSIGLGLAEVAAPRRLARWLGAPRRAALVRTMGAREITSGIGMLRGDPSRWAWSRFAGDVLDLSMLGAVATAGRARRVRLATAAAAVGAIALLDLLSGLRLSGRSAISYIPRGPVQLHKAITINRPPEDLYSFWRNFENLPTVMKHLDSVRQIDSTLSHWILRAPMGWQIEWDSHLTEDRPNQLIAWRSIEGPEIKHAGRVRFESRGDRGTVVDLKISYDIPGGSASTVLAKVFGSSPEQQMEEDLQRFKQFIETGEISTVEGQPAGPSAFRHGLQA